MIPLSFAKATVLLKLQSVFTVVYRQQSDSMKFEFIITICTLLHYYFRSLRDIIRCITLNLIYISDTWDSVKWNIFPFEIPDNI